MLKSFKKAAACVLTAALALSAMTGCAKKVEEEKEAFDTSKAVITMGDRTVSAGTVNLMLRYNQTINESYIGSFYRAYYGDWLNLAMFGNGETGGDMLRSQTVTMVEHMLLDEAHMADYGVELTEDDKKAIKEAAAAFIEGNDPEILEKMSATQESVEEMLTLYTIQSKVEAKVKEGADPEVSDEEAAQRTVSYVVFTASTEAETEAETEEVPAETEADGELPAETETAEAVAEAETYAAAEIAAETEVKTNSADETEEQMAAADETEEALAEEETETEDPAMAEARRETLAAAEAFYVSVKEANAEEFAAAAAAAAEASSKVNTGTWTFGADSETPDAAIIEATEGLEDNTLVGRVVIVGNNYYVIYVTDAFNEEATQARKEEIFEERKDALVASTYETWMGETEFTVDEAVLGELAFDYILTADFSQQDLEAATEDVSELYEEVSEAGSETAME